MKHTLITLCCLFSFFSLSAQSSQSVQLQDVLNGSFRAQDMVGVVPIPGDGEHFSQMNENGTQIIKYSFKTGRQVEVLFDASTARECPFTHFDSYEFSPDGTKLLIATETQPIYRRSYIAQHYLYSLRRNNMGNINNKVEKLSEGGPQQSPVFSPDGNMVAFVRDNNIFLVKLLYDNSESQVTKDGKRNEIINGIPDWVYEEEFSFNCAMDFSADSQVLAYIRFDEREVPTYSFQLFAGESPRLSQFAKYPGLYSYKYPKTGEPNSKVSVMTFDIKSRVTRKMQVPMEDNGYIPRIRFTKDASKLAIMTLNRHQNRFDLYMGDPKGTVCKLILRDECDTYIKENVFDQICFYDNHFSFVSEKSGFNHLYWYNLNGDLLKQVTTGNFELSQFLGYSAEENAFYYTSNEGSTLRKALFKIDGKGKKQKLSDREGTNSALFSSDMKYYINRFSSANTPTIVTLNDNKGKVLTTLIDNAALQNKLKTYQLPQKEFFTFTTTDGTVLNGWMMKPTDFNASKKYPVIQYQYSGPGSQEVTDAYKVSWETYMATQGFIMVCVDGRGTGGRGVAFEKCTYQNLGVKESQDQVATAQYLGTLPYVDKDRIGIWGWSYGGYMTLMSMSQDTPVFKAGVAVAPVTDWKYYDSVYGERFMRTPQENADGYKNASCMERAEKLHGNLLICHGLADDNVHYQNTAEYAERLVQLGKQFDMQIYTNRNHSIYGGNTRNHLYTRITNFFKANL